jgi:signal transduction histidine kinase
MTPRTRGRLAWSIAIASTVVCVSGSVISLALGWSNDVMLSVTVILATLSWGAIGALIASHTGNRIGWALLSVIGLVSLTLFAQTYSTLSLVELERRLPLDEIAGLTNQVSFLLALALIVAIPLLYPTGRARWRWAWRVYVGALTVLGVGWVVLPQQLSLAVDADVFTPPQNPLGIEAVGPAVGVLLGVAGMTVIVCAVLAVVSLILRYREAEGDARQQIRWLAYVGVAAMIAFLGMIISIFVFGDPPAPGAPTVISNGLFAIMTWVVVFGIPAACGVAILRYHLYDLDVVIKKTLVALVLAVMLGAIGLAAVALVGQFALWEGTPRGVSVVIGILLGLLLVPLLRLSRRVANRIVYGRRATPYEVLATFSGRVGEAYSTDDVLPRMAQILLAGSGAASARVLVRVGGALRQAAEAGDRIGDEHVEPIVFQGGDVGALAVSFPPNDPMDARRRQLIEHLASQAGPVVRNVRLIEELRASRQRLVAAQDDERRKLERNIHDGVQQQLVALAVKLRLADTMLDRDPAKAHEALAALQTDTGTALEDLRDLARGIYPPLLADKGLAAALEAQARKAAVPTTVEADGVGRHDENVESAVYFCSLEALNNIAKYANASAAAIKLEETDGRLSFRVTDDGEGFDTTAMSYGTGLQGMADRLDAIGGELRVTSDPGAGTSVTGTVPV